MLRVVCVLSLLAPAWRAGADELGDALALLERIEQTSVTVDYHDQPLESVLADLATRMGVPVRGDWPSLWRLGVRPEDEVSLRLGRAPGARAIAALTLVLGDEFGRPVAEVHAGQVVLTTETATAAMRLTAAYDVRDLLAVPAVRQRLRDERPPLAVETPDPDRAEGADAPQDTAPPVAPATGEAEAAAEDDERGAPGRARSPGVELLQLIMDHVDPEAWLDYGGIRGRITERQGVLLVTAAPTTHARLRRALASLRRLLPGSLDVRAVLLELPAGELRTMARGRDLRDRSLARDLVGRAGDREVWGTSLIVALGAEGVSGVDAETGSYSLLVAPQAEEESGRIRARVEMTATIGDEVRTVRTTLSLPARDGAAIIELPPAGAPAGDQLLLVLVF